MQTNPPASRTWRSKKNVTNPRGVVEALLAAGLPLGNGLASPQAPDGENDDSVADYGTIVCIGAMKGDYIHALVVTPSGFVYRFESDVSDEFFWRFSAKHYYWVTGNIIDREYISAMAGAPIKSGRALSSKRASEPSGMTLTGLLEALGCAGEAAVRQDLFACAPPTLPAPPVLQRSVEFVF